jgi:hypothetical protein
LNDQEIDINVNLKGEDLPGKMCFSVTFGKNEPIMKIFKSEVKSSPEKL